MRLKTIHYMAFLCLLCLVVRPVMAGNSGFVPALQDIRNSCTASPKQTASIHLYSADQKRLELARSFATHLQNKGQDARVIQSLYSASLKSGVDFELLLLKGILESDLGRLTEAQHSSARGIFQYIEPTWLMLIKRYGEDIGYPHYANAITLPKYSGIPVMKGKNRIMKAEILALRYDPDVSALIKALQVKEETGVIRSLKKGGHVTATDHYIAHMMGLPLAREFYDLMNRNSILAVARLNKPEMREAAKLNRPFFYKGRRPLTAPEAYRAFERRVKHEFKNIRAVSKIKQEPLCVAQKIATD